MLTSLSWQEDPTKYVIHVWNFCENYEEGFTIDEDEEVPVWFNTNAGRYVAHVNFIDKQFYSPDIEELREKIVKFLQDAEPDNKVGAELIALSPNSKRLSWKQEEFYQFIDSRNNILFEDLTYGGLFDKMIKHLEPDDFGSEEEWQEWQEKYPDDDPSDFAYNLVEATLEDIMDPQNQRESGVFLKVYPDHYEMFITPQASGLVEDMLPKYLNHIEEEQNDIQHELPDSVDADTVSQEQVVAKLSWQEAPLVTSVEGIKVHSNTHRMLQALLRSPNYTATRKDLEMQADLGYGALNVAMKRGWITRVAKAVYQLTGTGQFVLERLQEVVDNKGTVLKPGDTFRIPRKVYHENTTAGMTELKKGEVLTVVNYTEEFSGRYQYYICTTPTGEYVKIPNYECEEYARVPKK